MSERVSPRRRGSYGIDAPIAPAFIAVLAALEFTLAILSGNVRILLAALVHPGDPRVLSSRHASREVRPVGRTARAAEPSGG